MPDWLLWLIAAGVLAGAETVSLAFVLIMFAGGAAAGAITAALGGPVVLQVFVAIVATVALLAGVRPLVRRHLQPDGVVARTGSDALVGQHALVISPVDVHDGRVRLNGGEWSARAYDKNQVLPVGTMVTVVAITGATAIVLHEEPYFIEGNPA